MYRKKYLIGVYAPLSEGETLLALCSDITEFSDLMGIKYDTAAMTLHYLFTKQTQKIRFRGRLCAVDFINIEEEV